MNRRPNILIFMTDQQRGDTVFDGSPVKVPRLDAFRRESVTFENAFCTAPHCCPSRASFFSGLYPSEHGVWNNVNVANTLSESLDEGVRLFSEELTAGGYELFFTGKWHISNIERPADRGWREGFVTGLPNEEDERELRWRNYAELSTRERPRKRKAPPGVLRRRDYGDYPMYGQDEHPFDDEEVIDSACGFLESRREACGPWTLFVGPKGPHDPYLAPARFLELYRREEVMLPPSSADTMEDKPALYRRMRRVFAGLSAEEQQDALRHYYAACSYEDQLFGRVLDALEASGQAADTIVVFLSDHGDYGGEHGLWCKGLPAFDAAYRIPTVIRWPKGVARAGRIVSRSISLVDFAPTLLEVAGMAFSAVCRNASGRSLVPLLRDQEPQDWDDTSYFMTNGNELYGIQRVVRTPTWKYVYNGFDFDELYNLAEDPGEERNLIEEQDCQGVVDELCARMWAFGKAHGERSVNPYVATALAPRGPASALEYPEA